MLACAHEHSARTHLGTHINIRANVCIVYSLWQRNVLDHSRDQCRDKFQLLVVHAIALDATIKRDVGDALRMQVMR